jgi:hypothetical protein
VNTLYYVDPTTRLVIAEQDYEVGAQNRRKLIQETSYDYRRPDPSLFDQHAFERGATLFDPLKEVKREQAARVSRQSHSKRGSVQPQRVRHHELRRSDR